MPRFYFNIRHENKLFIADSEGEVLSDLENAIRIAKSTARWILEDDIYIGAVKPYREFEITDDDGHLLAKIPFRDDL